MSAIALISWTITFIRFAPLGNNTVITIVLAWGNKLEYWFPIRLPLKMVTQTEKNLSVLVSRLLTCGTVVPKVWVATQKNVAKGQEIGRAEAILTWVKRVDRWHLKWAEQLTAKNHPYNHYFFMSTHSWCSPISGLGLAQKRLGTADLEGFNPDIICLGCVLSEWRTIPAGCDKTKVVLFGFVVPSEKRTKYLVFFCQKSLHCSTSWLGLQLFCIIHNDSGVLILKVLARFKTPFFVVIETFVVK